MPRDNELFVFWGQNLVTFLLFVFCTLKSNTSENSWLNIPSYNYFYLEKPREKQANNSAFPSLWLTSQSSQREALERFLNIPFLPQNWKWKDVWFKTVFLHDWELWQLWHTLREQTIRSSHMNSFKGQNIHRVIKFAWVIQSTPKHLFA